MSTEGFFNWIGTRIGEAIRYVIDLLSLFFDNLGGSLEHFIRGLSEALGINPTILSLLALIIGLWMLYRAVRALLQRAIIAALVWALLGLMVLGWLVG